MHIDEASYEATAARLREHAQDVHEHVFADSGRGRAVYVTDPDGNVLEFWTWDVAGHLSGE